MIAGGVLGVRLLISLVTVLRCWTVFGGIVNGLGAGMWAKKSAKIAQIEAQKCQILSKNSTLLPVTRRNRINQGRMSPPSMVGGPAEWFWRRPRRVGTNRKRCPRGISGELHAAESAVLVCGRGSSFV